MEQILVWSRSVYYLDDPTQIEFQIAEIMAIWGEVIENHFEEKRRTESIPFPLPELFCGVIEDHNCGEEDLCNIKFQDLGPGFWVYEVNPKVDHDPVGDVITYYGGNWREATSNEVALAAKNAL